MMKRYIHSTEKIIKFYQLLLLEDWVSGIYYNLESLLIWGN
jgi:hypothetical protein